MSKTIQLVIASESLTCEQKIAYLADFLGRINSAIKMKSFTLTQLEVIIKSAAAEIQRLQKEIRFNEDSIFELDVSAIENQLTNQMKALE